jgi:hypothetical protein
LESKGSLPPGVHEIDIGLYTTLWYFWSRDIFAANPGNKIDYGRAIGRDGEEVKIQPCPACRLCGENPAIKERTDSPPDLPGLIPGAAHRFSLPPGFPVRTRERFPGDVPGPKRLKEGAKGDILSTNS